MLAGLAGFVDAVGFVHLGGYFLSFMSGNTTRFAAEAAHTDWVAVGKAGGIIGCFFVGVMIGAVVARAEHARPLLLSAISTSLLCAALVGSVGAGTAAMLILAVTMGAMNSVFQRNGEVSVGLTYMTGTLVKAGQRLVDALCGGPRWLWLRYLSLWLSLAVGAVLGALTYRWLELAAIWVAFGLAVAVTVVVEIVRRRRLSRAARQ